MSSYKSKMTFSANHSARSIALKAIFLFLKYIALKQGNIVFLADLDGVLVPDA